MNNDESIKQKAEALKSPRMQKALSEIERILKEMEIKRELKRMKQKTITIASSKMRKIKTVYSIT